MIYFKHGYTQNIYSLESYIYDCDPWPTDHRAVITEFAVCSSMNIGDFNLDETINILDITLLVNELLYSSNIYCIHVYADFDNNQELNILDIVQLVNIILS